jgi:Protein of unknown function (DUF1003)
MNSEKAARAAVRSERQSLTRHRRRLQDRIADRITDFAGSMAFVYLHVVWFTAWIVINVTRWAFDPFPFGLLTLIESANADQQASTEADSQAGPSQVRVVRPGQDGDDHDGGENPHPAPDRLVVGQYRPPLMLSVPVL